MRVLRPPTHPRESVVRQNPSFQPARARGGDRADDRSRVRTVGVLAHVDAGKTTVTERILYLTGAVHAQGEVHDGTTVTDFDPEEHRRGVTIFATAVTCPWAGHRITLIDTPGHVDFSVEVERSLRVLDGVVVVLDGVAGVEPQTEAVWRLADVHRLPRIVLVNKLDRPGADLDAAVASLRRELGAVPLVVQVPIGREAGFVGVVDLVAMRAVTWVDADPGDRADVGDPGEPGGAAGGMRVGPVPVELAAVAWRARRELEEAVAERHAHALEAFATTATATATTGTAGRAVPDDVLAAAVRDLVCAGEAVAVLGGAAYRNRGIEPLLDAVCAYLPSPVEVGAVSGTWQGRRVERAPDPAEPLAALVFKVVSAPTGRLTFVRVYSGTLEKGATVMDALQGRVERAGRILQVQADRHTEVARAVAGDIVALVGLKGARTGTTLCVPSAPVLLTPPGVPAAVLSVAVEPQRRVDSDRLAQALSRLLDDDPSLTVRTDPQTGQTLLSGLGELHLEVTVTRLERDHGVRVTVGRPQVAYRQTVEVGVRGVTYRHVKQDGGAGQFAVVTLDVEPWPDAPDGAEGFAFESTVVGGAVPREYVRAVEAGCRDALQDGPLGGHPVTGLRVRLTDGAVHVKDSSEPAFRVAGRLGLAQALRRCRMRLLEPVTRVTVTVPPASLGGVLGDLASRRGRILASPDEGTGGDGAGSGSGSGSVRVTADVPLQELFGYATALRSRTSGRGTVTTRPAGYDVVPDAVSGRVLGP